MKSVGVGILILLATTSAVYAQEGFGLGIIVGEPTGISIKNWLGEKHAIDAAGAWSFSENQSFQFHLDYLVHFVGELPPSVDENRLSFFTGIGGRIKFKERNDGKGRNDDEHLLGVRIPLGVSYPFAGAPVEMFVELVPILDVFPDTEFDINGAIGARYYFR